MLNTLYVFLFRFFGWRTAGQIPDFKKYIIAVGPHTSNWDFLVGVGARAVLKIQKAQFLGKSQLFKPPFGWFFRKLGGHPVDRSSKQDMVEQVVNIFNKHDEFILAMAPEGTRKKVQKLKTGFYYIAKGAHVPIVPVGFDFLKKEVIVGPTLYPSDDFEGDMQRILTFYRTIHARNPSLAV